MIETPKNICKNLGFKSQRAMRRWEDALYRTKTSRTRIKYLSPSKESLVFLSATEIERLKLFKECGQLRKSRFNFAQARRLTFMRWAYLNKKITEEPTDDVGLATDWTSSDDEALKRICLEQKTQLTVNMYKI